jgi:Transglutaminase-like superfamily
MASPSPDPSRLFNVDCKLSYTLLDDTHFLFIVHALDGMDQAVVEESLRLTPAIEYELHADAVFGHRTLRLKASAGPLTLRYRARVRLERALPDRRAKEMPIEALPHDVLPDLMPTRYCESDRLASAATKMFGAIDPGYARVQAVCDWIHEHIEYRVGSTNTTTTACDVFLQRSGVCRDFAHLGVAFCRAGRARSPTATARSAAATACSGPTTRKTPSACRRRRARPRPIAGAARRCASCAARPAAASSTGSASCACRAAAWG